jgi:hypothetical protein
MEEATCEKRNARGGVAACRNEKAGREKKVSLETSPPLQKLSLPFWPPFFSRQWRGKMERFLENLYTKHLQTPHVRSLWRDFAPGSSKFTSKKKALLSTWCACAIHLRRRMEIYDLEFGGSNGMFKK